jgi:hypothetical protein
VNNQSFEWLRKLNLESIRYRVNGISEYIADNNKFRNQCYEYMISRECNNKICYDIGVGSGLLTILALKHGAKHVYSFEKNEATAEFFRNIVYELNLQDKVTLVNDTFALSKLETYGIDAPDVVMHYMRYGTGWSEKNDIFDAFDSVLDNVEFLPGFYGVEIKELAIDSNIYNKLLRENSNFSNLDTGIDGIEDFENLCNKFKQQYHEINPTIVISDKLESLIKSKAETIANCIIDVKNQSVRIKNINNEQLFKIPLIVENAQFLSNAKNKESIIICDYYIMYKETKFSLQKKFLLKNSKQNTIEINVAKDHYVWLSCN